MYTTLYKPMGYAMKMQTADGIYYIGKKGRLMETPVADPASVFAQNYVKKNKRKIIKNHPGVFVEITPVYDKVITYKEIDIAPESPNTLPEAKRRQVRTSGRIPKLR